MKKPSALIVATLLACPPSAADQTREQKRLATVWPGLKEIMDVPMDSKDLLTQWRNAYCDSISPEVSRSEWEVTSVAGRSRAARPALYWNGGALPHCCARRSKHRLSVGRPSYRLRSSWSLNPKGRSHPEQPR